MIHSCKTVNVPEAGRIYYGLGRNASYEAARRGLIPTIEVLGKKGVPIVLMDRRLEQADANTASDTNAAA